MTMPMRGLRPIYCPAQIGGPIHHHYPSFSIGTGDLMEMLSRTFPWQSTKLGWPELKFSVM